MNNFNLFRAKSSNFKRFQCVELGVRKKGFILFEAKSSNDYFFLKIGAQTYLVLIGTIRPEKYSALSLYNSRLNGGIYFIHVQQKRKKF